MDQSVRIPHERSPLALITGGLMSYGLAPSP
jgi:hypothetical protein